METILVAISQSKSSGNTVIENKQVEKKCVQIKTEVSSR